MISYQLLPPPESSHVANPLSALPRIAGHHYQVTVGSRVGDAHGPGAAEDKNTSFSGTGGGRSLLKRLNLQS